MTKYFNNWSIKLFSMAGLLILPLLMGCGSLGQTADNVAGTTGDIRRTVAVVAGKVDKVTGAVERTTEKVEEVRDEVKASITNVTEKFDDTVNGLKDDLDRTIATLKENVRAEVDKAIAPIDSNGDGKADFGEAIAHIKKDDNWKDPSVWLQTIIAVIGSLLTAKAAAKAAPHVAKPLKPLVAMLHKTGRAELEKRGEPSGNGGGDTPQPPNSS
jgi:hypothetical protein